MTPPEVRLPPWLVAAVGASVALGVALGASGDAPLGQRVSSAVFHGGAFGYLSVSVVDFVEHLALERAAGGGWLSSRVIPLGESLNHLATVAVIVATLTLGRPLSATLDARDVFVLLAPALVMALGWRDEVVYHRRRCAHREDIMHTIAHLGLATMLSGFYATRLVPWATL